MPDLSDWYIFIQDKLKRYIYLSLDYYNSVRFIFHILTNYYVALKTVWIQINWLLKKPADLGLHCLQGK